MPEAVKHARAPHATAESGDPLCGKCRGVTCSFLRLIGRLDCTTESGIILRQVFEALTQRVQYDWAAMVAIGDDGRARTRAVYRAGELTLPETGAPLDANTAAGWAVTHETQLYRRDIRDESSFCTAQEEALGLRSDFIVPLITAHGCIGTLQIASTQPDAFSHESREFMVHVAALLATTLGDVRRFEELNAELTRLGLLDDIARTISSSLDAGDILEIILREIARVIPVARLAIAVPGDDADTYRVVIARDESGSCTRPVGQTSGSDETIMARAFASGDVYYCRNTAELSHRVETELYREGLRSCLYVPVRTGERTIACVSMFREESDAFEPSEIEFLRKLSGHLATAIRNAELFSELDQSYHRLEAAQEKMVISERLQALGEMSNGVAHDFNNVLSIILGNVQLLHSRIEDPELRRRLCTIEKAAIEGSGTVKRLQEFAQLRSDQKFIALDFNELIGDVIDLVRARWSGSAESRAYELDFQPRTQGTVLVRGNAADLREVFSSIVFNAFEAMSDGGRVQIETVLEGKSVVAVITDNGPGIPLEAQSRIFEPFYTTKGVQTTGLGLSVTYGIVARHGGEITVESEPGNGATFTVRMPVENVENIVPPDDAVMPDEGSDRTPRILVVDDEDDIRQLIEEILVQSGFEVEVASGGHEALGRFGASHFDLVLTDLGMPDLTGWDVAEKVKTKNPNVKVAIITGWGCSVAKDDPRMVHVDVLMAKPVSIVELNENIEKLISVSTSQ